MYASGCADFAPSFHAADSKECASVCKEFGLDPSDIGLVLRAVVVGANMHNNQGVCDWNPLEMLKFVERAPDGSLQPNDQVMDPNRLHAISCRGGEAMLHFPEGLDALTVPEHGDDHNFPESPWGLLPRLTQRLMNLPSDTRSQNLTRLVNNLVGWQDNLTSATELRAQGCA